MVNAPTVNAPIANEQVTASAAAEQLARIRSTKRMRRLLGSGIRMGIG
jgi:hypothetical protein